MTYPQHFLKLLKDIEKTSTSPDLCPDCQSPLEEVEEIYDYNDPGDRYGHGQFTRDILACEACGYSQPIIIEEEYEHE